MKLINQFDMDNPEHVTVFTTNGQVVIHVIKDGGFVQMSFPLRTPPTRLPLQQES